MTIPALRELRRIFPDSRIFLHTRSWALGIFQDVDFIDQIIPFDRRKSSFQTIRTEARNWREEKFDLAILFPNSFESALLAKFGRVPQRFGYAKEGRSFLLTKAVPIPVWKNERHEVFYYLNLIAEVEKGVFKTETVGKDPPRFELEVSMERKTEARKILTKNGVDQQKKLFAMVPGSTNSRAKRWPAESFSRLNDLLKERFDAEVVLLGSAEEIPVAGRVAECSSNPPIDLTGKTTLAEVTAILSLCDLLISNDTGPAHIGAALGTGTLVIFGPTNPKTTRPWNSEIIRRDVECSPCMLRDCPIDHRCMIRIQPEDILEKVLSMI